MVGQEAKHMINKAEHGSAFDPNTGYNYPQLISKFAMGAVFYNQALSILMKSLGLIISQIISLTRMAIIQVKNILGTRRLDTGELQLTHST